MATGRIGTTPVLQVRWSKAPSAGTTSLSGLDDNSVSLVYSVGYEAVYRNGVLLSRTNDYTATDGTTITLIDATITGDIIEVFANQTIPLSDTYSQTVANGKFINNTLTTTTGDIIYASAANTPARLGIGSTDQVLKVSGGIPVWATPASGGMTLLSTTSMSGTSVTVSSIPSGYNHLQIIVDGVVNDTTDAILRMQLNGETGSVYAVGTSGSTSLSVSTTRLRTGGKNTTTISIFDYTSINNKSIIYSSAQRNTADTQVVGNGSIQSAFETTVAITSVTFFMTSSENITAGSIRIYGVK